MIAQAIGAAVCAVWAFGLGFVVFKILDKWFGIRVSPGDEIKGLDVIEHGAPAYPDFMR